ncbi:MAG: hypothetical protein WKF96_18485 [Solirubrobacteraceae bacterium]
MALPAQVPRPFADQFEALAQLPADKFEQLATSLRDLPPFGSEKEVVAAVGRIAGDSLDAETLSHALISMLVQVPDMRRELATSISRSADVELSEEERDELDQRLSRLLELEALSSIGKADDIITDHEHVFRGVRILTDVRPVFGGDISAPPEAAVLVAMLRIDHQTNGRRKSMYFALDQKDLAALKQVVDRAITKTRSLEEFLSTAGLAHYQHQESHDEDT